MKSQAFIRNTAVSLFALLVAAPTLHAQTADGIDYKKDPQKLVAKVVSNELASSRDKEHFRFKLRKETPKGSSVKEIIETDRGSIARMISINDQPLNADARKKDDDKLDHLLRDPDEQEKKFKEQKEDGSRSEEMVKLLPVAFNYKYAGTEETPDGEVVDLKFEPNPDFDPPTREAQVYSGMTGIIGLNVKYMRLYKIDAHLIKDVNFGWGILGKLYEGGTLYVEQHHIEGERWEATKLFLNLTGKALLFKSLEFKSKEYSSDFHRVPDSLSLEQGAQLLRRPVSGDQMARGASASGAGQR